MGSKNSEFVDSQMDIEKFIPPDFLTLHEYEATKDDLFSNFQRRPGNSTISLSSYATLIEPGFQPDVLPPLLTCAYDTKSKSEQQLKKPQRVQPPVTPPEITFYVAFCTWFTLYRKLFVGVFCLNCVGIGFELANRWSWATRHLNILVIGNILVAVAIRSEWVLRLLYWAAVKLFRHSFIPVCIRAKIVGVLYHIGGAHSGCGLSALGWLITAVYRHFKEPASYHVIILITLASCLLCVLLTCSTAIPFVRGSHHNLFEITHRFIGWFGIICTFMFVILSSMWDSDQGRWDAQAAKLAAKVELWFLVAIVFIIIGQWITVSQQPVVVSAASAKASVIKFPGGLTSGLHTRISKGGLREWHIFGTISEGKHADCHYVVAAVQGGFTEMINREQPTKLYTKTWKICGLPYFSRMFKRGVAICTGSGIGAVGSTCIQHDDWFLVWIGPDLEKTYGSEILELISSRIPMERRLIWDTRGPLGRPDVVKLLNDTFRTWEAEVALFIGSPALNKNVLQAAKALSLPVFGSIWDA